MKRIILGLALDVRQIGPMIVIKIIVAKTPYTFKLPIQDLIKISEKNQSYSVSFTHEFKPKGNEDGA